MILGDFCKTLGFSGDTEKVLAPVWQEMLETFPGELVFLEDDVTLLERPQLPPSP